MTEIHSSMRPSQPKESDAARLTPTIPDLVSDLWAANTPAERAKAIADIKTVFSSTTRKGDTTLEVGSFGFASGSEDRPVKQSGKPGQPFDDIRVQRKNGNFSISEEEVIDAKTTRSMVVSENNGTLTYSVNSAGVESTTTHNKDGSIKVSTPNGGSITLYNDHRDIVFPNHDKRTDSSTPDLLTSFQTANVATIQWEKGDHYNLQALANPSKQ